MPEVAELLARVAMLAAAVVAAHTASRLASLLPREIIIQSTLRQAVLKALTVEMLGFRLPERCLPRGGAVAVGRLAATQERLGLASEALNSLAGLAVMQLAWTQTVVAAVVGHQVGGH